MQNLKDSTRTNGFTLIEILVVIGIIGLLSVFLVPNLLGVKDRAREVAVKAVMHSLQLAIEAYQMENEVYPMGASIALRSLCENYLLPGEYLASVPKNPFTGKEYTDADAGGKIIYSYDDNKGVYTLTGHNRSGLKVILELTNL